nr:hypothetical protein [Tanacetum cinerariifolium]
MSRSMSTTKASPKSQLYFDDLEIGVTGFMIVMVCRIWDVNATPGRYLSTAFVIYDSKANVAHNFLKLKECGIYSVKDFLVHPNKDEFRILMNASFIVEFDGETSVRKAFVKSDGFIRYPFELVELENLEVTNNKYLIDVIGYVTNVGRTVQQRSGTRTLDFYLANSSSSTMIIDDDGILALKQMKDQRGRRVTLMIVGYGQDAAALSPECEEGGISQHYSLLNAYITSKAPEFRFKERLKANNAFLGDHWLHSLLRCIPHLRVISESYKTVIDEFDHFLNWLFGLKTKHSGFGRTSHEEGDIRCRTQSEPHLQF